MIIYGSREKGRRILESWAARSATPRSGRLEPYCFLFGFVRFDSVGAR